MKFKSLTKLGQAEARAHVSGEPLVEQMDFLTPAFHEKVFRAINWEEDRAHAYEEWSQGEGSEFEGKQTRAADRAFQQWYRSEVEDRIIEFEWEISQRLKQGWIEVWREITVTDKWHPLAFPLGVYWSWDPEAAIPHWGSYHGRRNVQLHARAHTSQIDWLQTFLMNCQRDFKDEKEIHIRTGGWIELIAAQYLFGANSRGTDPDQEPIQIKPGRYPVGQGDYVGESVLMERQTIPSNQVDGLEYLIDPTGRDLFGLMQEVLRKRDTDVADIRVLVGEDGHVYAWDAHKAAHYGAWKDLIKSGYDLGPEKEIACIHVLLVPGQFQAQLERNPATRVGSILRGSAYTMGHLRLNIAAIPSESWRMALEGLQRLARQEETRLRQVLDQEFAGLKENLNWDDEDHGVHDSGFWITDGGDLEQFDKIPDEHDDYPSHEGLAYQRGLHDDPAEAFETALRRGWIRGTITRGDHEELGLHWGARPSAKAIRTLWIFLQDNADRFGSYQFVGPRGHSPSLTDPIAARAHLRQMLLSRQGLTEALTPAIPEAFWLGPDGELVPTSSHGVHVLMGQVPLEDARIGPLRQEWERLGNDGPDYDAEQERLMEIEREAVLIALGHGWVRGETGWAGSLNLHAQTAQRAQNALRSVLDRTSPKTVTMDLEQPPSHGKLQGKQIDLFLRTGRFKPILTEAKHAKPMIMYHGTSGRLARAILKQGMLADPKQRTWSEDPHTSAVSVSRASLSGSYWTTNFGIARSAVSKANQANKQPEEDWRDIPGLIVIAQIVPQSAMADEDSINGPLGWAWTQMMKDVLGVIPTAVSALTAALYYPHGSVKGLPEKLLASFTQHLHEGLRDSERQPIPQDLIARTFQAETMRMIAHSERERGDSFYDIFRDVREHLPAIPSVDQAERELLQCKDALTKYYRKSAKTPDFMHTLRMTRDVGFSGPSRIIAVVQYSIMDSKTPLILLYGSTVPEDFVRQYSSMVGRWPGVVRPDGTQVPVEGPVMEAVRPHSWKFWWHPQKGFFEWDGGRGREESVHHADYVQAHPELFGKVPDKGDPCPGMAAQGWVRGGMFGNELHLYGSMTKDTIAAGRAAVRRWKPLVMVVDVEDDHRSGNFEGPQIGQFLSGKIDLDGVRGDGTQVPVTERDHNQERLDRASKLGFDTTKVWYHGTSTPTNFTRFKAGKGGYDELGPGIYLVGKENLYVANLYASSAAGGRVIPCYIRSGPVWNWDAYEQVRTTKVGKNMLEPIVRAWVTWMQEKWGPKGATLADARERVPTFFITPNENANRLLKLAGFIGAVKRHSQADQIVVFDPNDIRSTFAKFNKPQGSLSESVVYKHVNPDTKVRWSIHKNPTPGQVRALHGRTQFERLRGWLNPGGDLFVWDAEQAEHWSVVHKILPGQAMEGGIPFEIESRPPGLGVLVWAGGDELAQIDTDLRANPHFARALPGVEINGDPDLHESVLTESVEEIAGIPVLVDPSRDQFLRALARTEDRYLRGIIFSEAGHEHLIVWDGFKAVHGDIAIPAQREWGWQGESELEFVLDQRAVDLFWFAKNWNLCGPVRWKCTNQSEERFYRSQLYQRLEGQSLTEARSAAVSNLTVRARIVDVR